MPTLRDLTETIQKQPSVQSVVLLGSDGLVIETQVGGADRDIQLDPDTLAAHAPAVAVAARQLGEAARLGDSVVTLLEFEQGYGIVMRLSPHAFLFVSADANVALGDLLFELRRHRGPMAALV